MNTETIMLIVSILFVFGVYIFVLIMAGRWDFVRGFIPRRRIRVAQVLGFLFGCLVVTYLFYHLYEIKPNYWIEISLLVGLVGATVVYALLTFTQAREMREQRQGEARPYLLLRLNGEAIQWVDIEPNERRPTEFEVTIRNVGNGPAINLWAARWSHEKSFFGDSKGYLAPNEEWTTGISNVSTMIVRLRAEKDIWLPELREVIENKYPGIVAVKYNDIHHRVWVSYLCLEWHHSVDGYVMEGDQNIVEVNRND